MSPYVSLLCDQGKHGSWKRLGPGVEFYVLGTSSRGRHILEHERPTTNSIHARAADPKRTQGEPARRPNIDSCSFIDCSSCWSETGRPWNKVRDAITVPCHITHQRGQIMKKDFEYRTDTSTKYHHLLFHCKVGTDGSRPSVFSSGHHVAFCRGYDSWKACNSITRNLPLPCELIDCRINVRQKWNIQNQHQ